MTQKIKKSIEEQTGSRLWVMQPIHVGIVIFTLLVSICGTFIGVGNVYGNSQTRLVALEAAKNELQAKDKELTDENKQLEIKLEMINEIKINLKTLMNSQGLVYVPAK